MKKKLFESSLTDEEEKIAVEEHFQLLYKERMLGLAMEPQSSTLVNRKLAFFYLYISGGHPTFSIQLLEYLIPPPPADAQYSWESFRILWNS